MSKKKKIVLSILALVLLIAILLTVWFFAVKRPADRQLAAEKAARTTTAQQSTADSTSPVAASSESSAQTDITITVEVTHGDGTVRDFDITTGALYLSDALTQESLIEGHEDTYGLYIDTVDGETVSADDKAAWCFTKSGAYVDTGASSTLISDGDHYEFYIYNW